MNLPNCIAFDGDRCIASGDARGVALIVKEALDRNPQAPVLTFELETGRPVDFDLRGTPDEVVQRIQGAAPEAKKPGRTKLGVVAREVTLLPRHWDWLSSQPGGASVALRKLVEEARKTNAEKDRHREAQEAAYRFISAMAGNRPGFEEATRALFAGNRERFELETSGWPPDVREHASKLAASVFEH